jgi:1,4-dihydroxy-2-naphthoate polyprenyltransferase
VIRAWLTAIRPRTLPAAVAPVVVGTGLAVSHDTARPWPAAAALAGALLIQIGTNLAND